MYLDVLDEVQTAQQMSWETAKLSQEVKTVDLGVCACVRFQFESTFNLLTLNRTFTRLSPPLQRGAL